MSFLRDLRCWHVIPGSEPGGRWFDSNSRSLMKNISGVIGSTTDSKPVGQGSNPWGCAWNIEAGSGKFKKFSPIMVFLSPFRLRSNAYARSHACFRFTRLTSKVLWSNGYDTCLTNRKRWFDSIRDYFRRDAWVRQLAERLWGAGSNPALSIRVDKIDSVSAR